MSTNNKVGVSKNTGIHGRIEIKSSTVYGELKQQTNSPGEKSM